MSWREELRALIALGEVRFDEPMRDHTSFRLGGPADAFVIPGSRDELRRAVDFAISRDLPWLLLGRGSNLLVRDGGYRGIVLRTWSCLRWLRVKGREIAAGAGATLAELANEAAAHSLTGLAFAAGIPGTVGGGVWMNAGAYGGELSQVLTAVKAYYPGRGETTLTPAELGLAYRSSRFQHERAVIEEARFAMARGEERAIRREMATLAERRQERQPLNLPSAGSVFRRPPGGYAGPLIEEAGLKGRRIGGAQISAKHANFIVNLGGATARDVLSLIELIQAEVRARTGILLEPEVRVIGEDQPIHRQE